jgi:hypothetical protein
MARYGAPLASTEAQRQRAVLALSVYNAASFARRDLSVFDVMIFLVANWSPQWAPVTEVVDEEAVLGAARWLQELGFAQLDGSTVRIAVRDKRGLGRGLAVDYDAGTLRVG